MDDNLPVLTKRKRENSGMNDEAYTDIKLREITSVLFV